MALKCRSLPDFYLQCYPYKKNPPIVTSTIPKPYVKQKDTTEHRFSLTFWEWEKIVVLLIEEIIQELVGGGSWNVGSHIGVISFRKRKCKTFTDVVKSNGTGKAVKKITNEYDNYMVVDFWDRIKNPLGNKWLWRFRTTDELKLMVYKKTDEDYTHIYKFLDQ